MRVVWLLKTFGRGGAERLILELLPYLHDCDIIPVATHDRDNLLLPKLRGAGLEPRTLGASRDLDPMWIPALRALIHRLEPDIVHVHAPVPAIGARLGLLGSAGSIVYTEHNVWTAYRPATRIANALTYRLNDRTIAVSDAVMQSLVGSRLSRLLVGRTPVIVKNGIDLDGVLADATESRVPQILAGSFGTVSHLRPAKGIDVLIRAAALVQRRVPDASCVVVGDGALLPELRVLARRLGADVTFLGNREDARAIVARLDVFVMASRHEGLPLALLEAMALGRPIVATRAGGTPEVLADGENSLLVPTEDAPALAEAVVAVLNDPDLAARLGAEAADTARRSWSAQRTATAILRVYEEVVLGS